MGIEISANHRYNRLNDDPTQNHVSNSIDNLVEGNFIFSLHFRHTIPRDLLIIYEILMQHRQNGRRHPCDYVAIWGPKIFVRFFPWENENEAFTKVHLPALDKFLNKISDKPPPLSDMPKLNLVPPKNQKERFDWKEPEPITKLYPLFIERSIADPPTLASETKPSIALKPDTRKRGASSSPPIESQPPKKKTNNPESTTK